MSLRTLKTFPFHAFPIWPFEGAVGALPQVFNRQNQARLLGEVGEVKGSRTEKGQDYGENREKNPETVVDYDGLSWEGYDYRLFKNAMLGSRFSPIQNNVRESHPTDPFQNTVENSQQVSNNPKAPRLNRLNQMNKADELDKKLSDKEAAAMAKNLNRFCGNLVACMPLLFGALQVVTWLREL